MQLLCVCDVFFRCSTGENPSLYVVPFEDYVEELLNCDETDRKGVFCPLHLSQPIAAPDLVTWSMILYFHELNL